MTIAISSVSSVSSVFTERALRRPMAADVRRRLDADISIVFRMLNRCDWVREFILGSNVSADLLMLMSPLGAQSSFILETEEHQEGRLTGSIKLRYLVVPSFTTPEGLSGGAIVTSYALRDHPLHSPSVMANTRIGRYVRDNNTGEWLFLTRNETDNVTRMQWLHSSKSTTRERINLTCNSTLFNKGLLAESILFECHDEEWRPCPRCHSPPDANCSCSASGTAVALPKHPLDLRSVAAAALTEPKSEWFGRVQVSILSNLTKDLRGDVDACMNLRTSFEASQDAALALQMQNLALAERAKTVIPRHVSTPKLLTSGHVTGAAGAFGLHANAFSSFQKNAEESRSVLQSPVPLGPDTHYSSLPNGSMSHVMTEMLSGRDEKYVTLDAVVPELENRADKKVTQEVQNNGGSAFGAVPQQQMFSSPSVFDPMSLMVKHFAAGSPGNTLAPGSPGPGLQNVTVPHSGLANGHLQGLQQQRLQHQDKQQLQHNHEHQHLVMNATPADQNQSATLLHRVHDFSHGAPGQHAQGHSQSSHSSHSSGGRVDAEDEDEDDDDGGVFDADAGRHRMSNTKAFDTFLGTFVAPHQTSVIPSASAAASVDVNSLDNMELDSPWLNAGPLPSTVQKENPSLPSHDTQAHGEPEHVMPQRMQARVVAPPPQHGNPFPPHPISNGVHQRSSPLVLKQAMPVTPPNGPPKREHQGFVQSLGSPSANGVDQVSGDPVDPESGQPLARLEPRPPGMSACADGAWMWHMGPRGPFGMAAIAAARERERRAEERRRKNREAAARSNARAKERLERIKGELEKNKDRISRLSRKRRELELQNNTLKQRLAQQAS